MKSKRDAANAPITGTPRCFHNHQQFTQWMHAARITGGCQDTGFCTDCTPEFKAKMIAQERCEYPTVEFAPDEHGFIQGVFTNGKADNSHHAP